MAKLVQKGLDLTVGTWADLQALPSRRKVDGVKVTVLDAIGDSRTIGGSVIYQYIEAFSGTAEEWMIVGSADEESTITVEENLVISGGKVTITDIPNGNILFDVIVKWQENGDNYVEDVAYSLSGKDVFVSTVYNGKTLGIKYLKNNSGKLYQLGTGGTGGVSSWNDLTDKPTTLLGYGVEAEVDDKILAAINDITPGNSSVDAVISSVMLPPVIDKKVIASTVEQLNLLKTGSDTRVTQLSEFTAYTNGVKLSDAALDSLYNISSGISMYDIAFQKYEEIGTGIMITNEKLKDFYAKDVELVMSNLNNVPNANYSLSFVVGAYEDISEVLHTLTIRRKVDHIELIYDEGTVREDILISNVVTDPTSSFIDYTSQARTYIDVTKFEGQLSVKVAPFSVTSDDTYIDGQGIVADLKTLGAKVLPFIDYCSIGYCTYQPSNMPSNVAALFVKKLVNTTPIYSTVDDTKNTYDVSTETWGVDGSLTGDLTPGTIVYNSADGTLTPVTAQSISLGFIPSTGGTGISETQVNTMITAAIADIVDMAPESLNTLRELADGLGTVYTSTQTDTKITETVTSMFVAPATVDTVMMSLDV